MSIWDTINDKIASDVAASDNLLLSSFTTASGQTKTYRSLTEIAQGVTIAKNQAAADDREANGIFSAIQMYPMS